MLFEGGKWDLKWYVTSHLMAEASAVYQTNRNAMRLETKVPTAGFGAKAELSYANREGWTLGLFDVYTGPIPGFTLSANPHVAEAPVGGERSAGIREISRPGSEARGVFRPWQQSGRSSGVSTGVGLHLGGDSAV